MTEDVRPIRTIIVDDEELARKLLREFLEAERDVEIVAECANGFEAVKAATELDPDLLLLDIQMPKLDGFEVLELLDKPPAVVFVTAYDEFAMRAFEVHALDYVLKPFSAERLSEALKQARQRLARHEPVPVRELATALRSHAGPLERVLVREGSHIHVIPVEKLDYVEAQDDYICLKSGGRSFLKDQGLSDLEAALDRTRFVRIHRSYIVNVERVAKIELYAKDSRVAILRDGTRLPVSRTGYGRLSALL